MPRVVVDTNVLVSYFTEREIRQQDLADVLLKDAAQGEILAIIQQFVLFEMIFVLESVYEVESAVAASYLESLRRLPGVLIVDDCPWSRVLEYWPRSIRSLADAALVAVASGGRYDALATFDRKLARRLPKFGVKAYW